MPTYSISELAREFSLTPRTIRHYEDLGLLKPRREGTSRLFSDRDRARLRLALQSSRLGFSLRQIKHLFDLYEAASSARDGGEFSSKVGEWREKLASQRADIEALLGEIDFFARAIAKDRAPR
jgi:DNA-binding transcriptional MerR regulator